MITFALKSGEEDMGVVVIFFIAEIAWRQD
jgi:hypothetical protein